MTNYRTRNQTLSLIVLIVTVAGCTSRPPAPAPSTVTATSAPPTATGTSAPPTATATSLPPTATAPLPFTLATRAEDLIGTWRHPRGSYIRFYDDGTFHVGFSLNSLDSMPPIANTYAFDGSQIRVKEISNATGLSCGSDVGIYEVRLLEGDGIQIVVISDTCFQRETDTPGVYEAVP